MKKQYKSLLLSMMLGVVASCASLHKTPPPAPVIEPEPIEASAPVEVTPVVEATAPIIATPIPKSYTDNSVYYGFDKYNVEESYNELVKFNSTFLIATPATKVTLIGNTDQAGSVEYNLSLGQRRADGMKKILVAQGVKKSQIETVSLGKAKRKFSGDNEGRNRRVDIVYRRDLPPGYSMNESGIPQIDNSMMPVNNNGAMPMNSVNALPNSSLDNNAPAVAPISVPPAPIDNNSVNMPATTAPAVDKTATVDNAPVDSPKVDQ